jgi:DNA replication protein DnaC
VKCKCCGNEAGEGPLCPQCIGKANELDDRYKKSMQKVFEATELRLLGVPARFSDATFENLKEMPESNNKVIKKLNEYTSKILAGKNRWLVLSGPVGTGKSHLSCAMLKRTQFGKRYRSIDIVKGVQSSYENGDSSVFDNAMNQKFLVIDDLGSEKVNEKNINWVRQLFYDIIDHRWSNNLPTMITTNLTMSELEQRYGERFMSRLTSDTDVLFLEGKDMRIDW